MRQEDLAPTETSIATSVLPIITSENDPIRVDFLAYDVLPLPGRLGMTFAPGKCNVGMHADWQRNLEQDLTRLSQYYQTDRLVTLLEEPELAHLKIPDLFEQIQQHGMQTRWFPIPDFGTPASMSGLIQLVEEILAHLTDYQTIVIHCRAGLGRSGMVAASCLVAIGYTPSEAFKQVRQARLGSVETAGQEEYVVQFAHAWLNRKFV